MSILQRLYDSEINFEVAGFCDAGFDVRLGDALNGFIAESKVEKRRSRLGCVKLLRQLFANAAIAASCGPGATVRRFP
jgi:hypothetical protein